MVLKHYFPISVVVFVLVILTVRYFSAHFLAVPILPIALLLLAGETLIGFQVEDHRVSRLLGDLLRAFKSNRGLR